MAQTAPSLPGVRFEVRAPASEVSPLRTDIAGFIGPTLRGPVGEAVRVEGWRQYQDLYGDFTPSADTPYAVRGYFENGGEVAYVIRALNGASSVAVAQWKIGDVDLQTQTWDPSAPSGGKFEGALYEVSATTPGAWANGTRIACQYRLRGQNQTPEVDIEVRPPRGNIERLLGLPAYDLVEQVRQRSRLIRLSVLAAAPAPALLPGPMAKVWAPFTLGGAIEIAAGHDEYEAAAQLLADQIEVALMAAPDLQTMPGSVEQREHILGLLVALAEATHDRQLLLDVPPDLSNADDVVAWLRERRVGLDENFPRSIAVYHPQLQVPDPIGGVIAPLRSISPVGHVAGVVSRLDRERGAHHTPANAPLYEAVDLTLAYGADEQGALAMAGINPLRCSPGNGLVVWGGRTAFDPAFGTSGLFIAHRRLIHRLIRAIRRVAAPLVFDVNGPDLWLILVRAITSVLLEAWQAGALKGEVPEQAFLVRCDETTNPPESEDAGQVLCEVYLAPAVPMEFITLRIGISREGLLEVVES